MQINDLEYTRTSKIQNFEKFKNRWFEKKYFVQRENIWKVVMTGSIFNVKTFTAAVCLPLSAAIIGTSFRYIEFRFHAMIAISIFSNRVHFWPGHSTLNSFHRYLRLGDLSLLTFNLWISLQFTFFIIDSQIMVVRV